MARRSARGKDNRVREARLARDITQAELAGLVGVSRQTIVAIESGGYAPSVYLALGLGRVLGQSVETLFSVPDTDAAERSRTGASDGR